MQKTLIGITCNYLNPLPSAYEAGIGAREQAWQLIAQDYLEAVWRSGGIPVLLPVDRDENRALAMLELVDGLLLSGGNDLSPKTYKTEEQSCGILDPERDKMELLMCKKAIEEDKPILGICRGLQVMNVCQGGTLYQDLETAGYQPHSNFANKRNEPAHTVTVIKQSLLDQITGERQLKVNSFHHQAVREIGAGLQPAAISGDGVVEAVAMAGKKFVLALQWHPEMMYDSDQQQGIIRSFIQASAAAKKLKGEKPSCMTKK